MADEKKQDDIKNDSESNVNQLEECKQKCEEYLNNWKRERADFLNYKKDEIERIGFLAKYAKEDIVLKILPVLDSFHLAKKQLPDNLKEDTWIKGFLQIESQIAEFLKKEGILQIKSVGEKFDPSVMEIIEESEEGGSGMVIEELQKGYTMNGKVLRPTKVKVSK
ncbi:MAG: nucleotide exchange factor GrpE [Candidatus Staskawiczbacteria bacterium RIFCSPLOWO2_01_FULL_33_13]|nr:MAG: nucleotide exchange factor GrpE [Candidatus Staskawiczbacteria bacterium RIFCSPLOWO2_01_FULL_33_13]